METQKQDVQAPVTPASPVFDRGGEFEFHLRRDRKVIVGYPTDEDLAQRERNVKSFYAKGSALVQQEGREEADEALFAKILKGEVTQGGKPIDASSEIAEEVLGRLMKCSAGVPEQTATGYRIPLTVAAGIQTVHDLNEPTVKQKRKLQDRALILGDMRHGRQRAIGNPAAEVDFYDSLFIASEGYSGGKESIPANHKSAAIKAMLDQIKAEEDGDGNDPN